MVHELEFNACMDELPSICDAITKAARQYGMDEKCVWKLEVSLDEACTNIASYSYTSGESGKIWLKWQCENDNFILTIEDEGPEFDQTQPTNPDLNEKLSNRKPGGLGRYIMREFMDHLEYKRENNRNIITLTKNLKDQMEECEPTTN